MTKIQLKRIYKYILKYNKNDICEYNSLKDIAKVLSTKYTLQYQKINEKELKIYFPEFIVSCGEANGKIVVGNITYFTKNNQVRDLF